MIMGREWFEEVAARPGSYARDWACWVDGLDGQAFFDAQVLTASTSARAVLDCGCGDGAFTVQVAKKASHIVGGDFSSRMVANARRHAQVSAVENVTFLVSHARTPNLFPTGYFDLAYSRRGPHILTTVPEYVRPGGLSMAIHPEDISPDCYGEQIAAAGLECITSERFADSLHFPTLEDLARFLSRQPGQPDMRVEAYRTLLLEVATEYLSPAGDYVVPRTYLVWAARKPAP